MKKPDRGSEQNEGDKWNFESKNIPQDAAESIEIYSYNYRMK